MRRTTPDRLSHSKTGRRLHSSPPRTTTTTTPFGIITARYYCTEVVGGLQVPKNILAQVSRRFVLSTKHGQHVPQAKRSLDANVGTSTARAYRQISPWWRVFAAHVPHFTGYDINPGEKLFSRQARACTVKRARLSNGRSISTRCFQRHKCRCHENAPDVSRNRV